MGIVLGVVGFGLCFLYDINSVKWKNRVCQTFFFAGCGCLLAGTVLEVLQVYSRSLDTARIVAFGWLVVAGLFFALLIYTLFGALPFSATYRKSEEKSEIHTDGFYALCRHPGVLWFFFFYLSLGAVWRDPMFFFTGMSYSLCNLLYVVFQDFWVFPKTLEGYEAYKKQTPFLIPTGKSIMRCIKTFKK